MAPACTVITSESPSSKTSNAYVPGLKVNVLLAEPKLKTISVSEVTVTVSGLSQENGTLLPEGVITESQGFAARLTMAPSPEPERSGYPASDHFITLPPSVESSASTRTAPSSIILTTMLRAGAMLSGSSA